MMKIYDLSHPLNNKSPVYPGTPNPVFKPLSKIEKEGFRETRFNFHSHLGTHIDAPSHMIKNGLSLDKMPVSSFSGKAFIISIPDNHKSIKKKHLSPIEDKINKVEFILFRTGWSRFWGKEEYLDNYPVISEKALNWLLSFPLKGIGFDMISADSVVEDGYKNHLAILNKGMIIIENLIFPEDLIHNSGEFFCLPIPYKNADGSPVRAILKI